MCTSPKGKVLTMFASVSLLLLPAFVDAAPPTLINYQGRLSDSSGEPVVDGEYSVTFAVYDAPSGGNFVWSEVQSVSTTNGFFSVLLGSVNPITKATFADQERYLSIQIGANPEQVPRSRFVTSAYAFTAAEADSIQWGRIKNIPAGFADGVDNNSGGDAFLSGDQTFTGLNRFDALVEFGDSTMRAGEYGIMLGTDLQPFGATPLIVRRTYNSTSTQYGVDIDVTNANSGTLRSLDATARSAANGGSSSPVTAVRGSGFSDNVFRAGVHGIAQPFSPASTSGESFGLFGEAWYGAYAYGGRGIASFAEIGVGIDAIARHSDVNGIGVNASADSSDGNGLGVYSVAEGNTSNGYGVYGRAISNGSHSYGVYGRVEATNGDGYGIYGIAIGSSGTNWAGYFAGDVNVTGTLVSPAKLTKLDHPLDPENKILVHSAVESPEMVNQHTGNIVLDASGEAVVTLPDWFEEVNRDFRYQLTCVGGYAPVFIAEEISGGQFKIAGGTPGLKVSWLITALRDDAYARAHPMDAQVAKRSDRSGKYLHPESYGLPANRGVDFEHTAPPKVPHGQ